MGRHALVLRRCGMSSLAANRIQRRKAHAGYEGIVRVLVAEDEEFLAEMIAEGLRRDAIAVDVAHDGIQALEKFDFGAYDVLVLDRDLPGVHGDEVCRRVVESGRLTRVLMLTASASTRERVEGLTLG